MRIYQNLFQANFFAFNSMGGTKDALTLWTVSLVVLFRTIFRQLTHLSRGLLRQPRRTRSVWIRYFALAISPFGFFCACTPLGSLLRLVLVSASAFVSEVCFSIVLSIHTAGLMREIDNGNERRSSFLWCWSNTRHQILRINHISLTPAFQLICISTQYQSLWKF